jgi:hypothetical protein
MYGILSTTQHGLVVHILTPIQTDTVPYIYMQLEEEPPPAFLVFKDTKKWNLYKQ